MILAIGGPAAKEKEGSKLDGEESNIDDENRRDAAKLLLRAIDSKSPDAVVKALESVWEAFDVDEPAEPGVKEEE
jgi:hypothetical protein